MSNGGGEPTINPRGGKLISWFDEAFGDSRSNICVQREGGKIFYQNSSCRKLCGNFFGKICPQTCVSSCEKAAGQRLNGEGLQFFGYRKVGNQHFDVLFFGEEPWRLILLYPLQRKYEAWMKRFQERNLSRRELEIANLCLQGLTNSKIMGELSISKATLKTHLNNLYKKIPEARSEGWRKTSTVED